ncbi:MAG: hypothetical protein U0165_11410 [Polyangiaceae bacterium]
MAPLRTAWHPLLVTALRGILEAPDYEVRDEVSLSSEPLRLDVVIVRATPGALAPELLQSILSSLNEHTLLSYKGATDAPEAQDATQLIVYAFQYMLLTGIGDPQQISLRMLASSITPRFRAHVHRIGGHLTFTRKGIWDGSLGPFSLRCVSADAVCDEPGESLLFGLCKRIVRHPRRLPPLDDRERLLFSRMAQQIAQLQAHSNDLMYLQLTMAAINYDQAWQEILANIPPERRLAGLSPEQRLAGLAPEQRVAGLAPELLLKGLAPEQRLADLPPEQRLAGLDEAHAVLALPVSLLRALSPEYIETLPEDVKVEVKRRMKG